MTYTKRSILDFKRPAKGVMGNFNPAVLFMPGYLRLFFKI